MVEAGEISTTEKAILVKPRAAQLLFFSNLCAGLAAIGLAAVDVVAPRWLAMVLAAVSWVTAGVYFASVSKHGVFSLLFIYLGALGLFHLPLAALNLVGLDPQIGGNWIESPHVAKALLLCAVAFSALTAGAVAEESWTLRRSPSLTAGGIAAFPTKQVAAGVPQLFRAGLGLWAVAALMLAIGVYQLDLFSGTYSDYYAAVLEKDTRFFGTGIMLCIWAAVITLAGAPARLVRMVIFGFLVTLSPLLLFGFRSYVITSVMAMTPAAYVKTPSFMRRFGAVAVVAVVVGSPIVKVLRDGAPTSAAELAQQATPIDFFLETGNSLRPVVETIGVVDAGGSGWWLGRSYAQASLRIFPNLSVERGTLRERSADAPGAWITEIAEPRIFEAGGGLGYSAVAEPFLNFGIPGVGGFFVVLGFTLSYLNRRFDSRPYFTAFVLCAFASLLVMVRNDSSEFFRSVSWSSMLVGGIYTVDAMLQARARPSAWPDGRRTTIIGMRRGHPPAEVQQQFASGWAARASQRGVGARCTPPTDADI